MCDEIYELMKGFISAAKLIYLEKDLEYSINF